MGTLRTNLDALCGHCQRPEKYHCEGCGACWPSDACALDCDVNEPHEPESDPS